MSDYERTETVDATADALFDYLSDVGNLPDYFERMTSAERGDGEEVHTTAEIDVDGQGETAPRLPCGCTPTSATLKPSKATCSGRSTTSSIRWRATAPPGRGGA